MQGVVFEGVPQLGSQSIEQIVELQQGLAVVFLSRQPEVVIEVFEQYLVDLVVGLVVVGQQLAEVLEGFAGAVGVLILGGD